MLSLPTLPLIEAKPTQRAVLNARKSSTAGVPKRARTPATSQPARRDDRSDITGKYDCVNLTGYQAARSPVGPPRANQVMGCDGAGLGAAMATAFVVRASKPGEAAGRDRGAATATRKDRPGRLAQFRSATAHHGSFHPWPR
jgi:hypothetical protein